MTARRWISGWAIDDAWSILLHSVHCVRKALKMVLMIATISCRPLRCRGQESNHKYLGRTNAILRITRWPEEEDGEGNGVTEDYVEHVLEKSLLRHSKFTIHTYQHQRRNTLSDSKIAKFIWTSTIFLAIESLSRMLTLHTRRGSCSSTYEVLHTRVWLIRNLLEYLYWSFLNEK